MFGGFVLDVRKLLENLCLEGADMTKLEKPRKDTANYETIVSNSLKSCRNQTIDTCNAYFISRLEEILMLKYTLHDCFKAIEKLIAELKGEGK